jgi:hypothetical protein
LRGYGDGRGSVGTAAGATAIARSGGELRDVDYLNVCCRGTTARFDAAAARSPSIQSLPDAPAAARRRDPEVAAARVALARAGASPDRARPDLRRARRAVARIRRIGQRLARTDDCGDVLGLLASHALDVIERARQTSAIGNYVGTAV